MLEPKRTWWMVLALALLAGCGGDADPDAGGGLDGGTADAGARDAASDAESPLVDSGAMDAGLPSDGGPPGTCSGEIVECRPEGSADFRCGGDSCPAACGDLAECTACAAHAMPPAIQSYFDALALPVVELDGALLHCGPAACSLAADFNGDGTEDWAGMFRNLEPRGGDFGMDLLIIYSDGAGYQHVQYPYFGRIVDGTNLAYLVLQNAGPITGYAVSLTLANPSIRVYRLGDRGSAPACYSESEVIYWTGSVLTRQGLSAVP
jgi:hypothetical protein